jgi:glycosyltransferase involved in cell wall biosynthesis
MKISICIPHYNRAQYLIKVLESIQNQDYTKLEVIISDDCSSDDSEVVIPDYIKKVSDSVNPIKFTYIRQPKNLGYDGNLRASLEGGTGDYLFTLGNDDALAEINTISLLVEKLQTLELPEIAFVNVCEYSDKSVIARRAQKTQVIGKGPFIAAFIFRSFSFVGGLAIKREEFKKHDTNLYDGTVYYQMYLAGRIIAAGGKVASIDESMIAKDVKIEGTKANSYLDFLAAKNKTIHKEFGGLDQVGRVACEAILPYVEDNNRAKIINSVYGQLLKFTYPFWLYDYRKNKVFKASLNLAIGCFPTSLVKIQDIKLISWFYLFYIYLFSTAGGLLIPTSIVTKLKGYFFSKSKSLSKLKTINN